MLRIASLIYLLHLNINAGITNALDEGSFLWAQKRAENLSNNDKSSSNAVRPGRWARSIFNWLHSPLINSIQEAFVADSIYENSPPPTKDIKRSILKNASDVNLESFENEFFLWEDNEGNPLEFGLKQIQDVRPCNQQTQNYRRFNRDQTDDLWEEPLIYEYNQDVKEVDTNHLSYHEKFKLNDILKNRLHNPFHHVFTFKHSTKHPSIYYTLEHSTISTTTVSTSVTSIKNSSNKEDFPPYLGNEKKNSLFSGDTIENEKNTATEISNKGVSRKLLSSPNESKHQSPYYVFSSQTEENNFTKLTTLKSSNPRNLTSIGIGNFSSLNSKDNFVQLKPRSDFHEANLDSEEMPRLWKDNLNNHGPMKSFDIHKNISNEASTHRKLRMVHHKRFLKYRRKKWKNNKLKYPEGHSYQYELFNGNFKPSGK
ncbi:uncharacterized protein [Halyomorpha halys]|uniref:uncharacterized protein isoform X2 n=1 Tax=Halyomorpha halys TaxID=286706 RepID=UPI0034D17FF1